MTILVGCLGIGKGSWAHVIKVIESKQWEQIILFTNAFGSEKFTCNKEVKLYLINPEESIEKIRDIMIPILKPISEEVAVNIVSGTGQEHMALFGAIMKAGLSFRLMDVSGEI